MLLQNCRQLDIITPMSAKSRKKKDKQQQTPRAVHKKAYRDYELLDRFEAGIALLGTEVKSLRAGQADLDGSYARILNDECWLVGGKIAQYAQAGSARHEPDRKRKLLLHKAEIRKIRIKLEQRGFTLVPLQIYFNDKGLAKVELALARGKRKYDKRRAINERTQKRDIERDMKKYRRK
ncbi:MAG TPA: SsrA-binding protein SmpB [Sedimentisphaerales bacterium]|nr:SsrA-binding protein SmpB [Sedimentisphaerales bacterium]